MKRAFLAGLACLAGSGGALAQDGPLQCSVERSIGVTLDGGTWRDAETPDSPPFRLKRVEAPPCDNDDFTCQAENPNYHLTSEALGDDFLGCFRPDGLDVMACEVFQSVLTVNFAKGVFSLLDDQGLISGDGGGTALRVGRCAAEWSGTEDP